MLFNPVMSPPQTKRFSVPPEKRSVSEASGFVFWLNFFFLSAHFDIDIETYFFIFHILLLDFKFVCVRVCGGHKLAKCKMSACK